MIILGTPTDIETVGQLIAHLEAVMVEYGDMPTVQNCGCNFITVTVDEGKKGKKMLDFDAGDAANLQRWRVKK